MFSDKANPSYIKYSSWTYIISLKVYDWNWKTNTDKYYLKFIDEISGIKNDSWLQQYLTGYTSSGFQNQELIKWNSWNIVLQGSGEISNGDSNEYFNVDSVNNGNSSNSENIETSNVDKSQILNNHQAPISSEESSNQINKTSFFESMNNSVHKEIINKQLRRISIEALLWKI